jgi:hypothetical protein
MLLWTIPVRHDRAETSPVGSRLVYHVNGQQLTCGLAISPVMASGAPRRRFIREPANYFRGFTAVLALATLALVGTAIYQHLDSDAAQLQPVPTGRGRTEPFSRKTAGVSNLHSRRAAATASCGSAWESGRLTAMTPQ